MCSSLGLLTSKNGKEEILFVAARPRSPLGGSLKTTGRCIFSECQNKWIPGLEKNIDNNHNYFTEYKSNVTLSFVGRPLLWGGEGERELWQNILDVLNHSF